MHRWQACIATDTGRGVGGANLAIKGCRSWQTDASGLAQQRIPLGSSFLSWKIFPTEDLWPGLNHEAELHPSQVLELRHSSFPWTLSLFILF